MANQNFRVKTGLEVGTGVTISAGIVTAVSFRGDGSALTGVAETTNVRTNSLVVSGVSTLGNTVVGGGTTQLIVNGDARITGILTIGTSSITLDGSNNRIVLGTGTTISSTGAATFNNGITVSGVTTSTSFIKSGGTSSQFLKADGSVDSSTYLTSYTETSTLANVTNRGNSTSNGISVGVVTATSLVKSGGTSSQFLKADGSIDSSTYLTSYTETSTLANVTSRGNSTSNGISVGVVTATTVNDSIGNVRTIPQNAQTSAYILAASDVGKHISITTGGVTVNASIFSAGDAVTIYNNSGSNQTITQGTSVTLRSAGTANTGNRTLAQYGVCTVLCVASNTFVISGAGLS